MEGFKSDYITNRLLLTALSIEDVQFILELVNSEGWIQFIGNRNVKTTSEANGYIQDILANRNIHYWVVRTRKLEIPIGIITFIKRDYLDHYDIGFAFLTQYTKQGYGYEAASVVLNDVTKNPHHQLIFGSTTKTNTDSIRLLEKLGFHFSVEMQIEKEAVSIYSFRTDNSYLDIITKRFYTIFTNKNGRQPDWDIIQDICMPDVIFIKNEAPCEIVYNSKTFIDPRRKMLSDGTMNEFEEGETSEETTIAGHMALRYSNYQKEGYYNGKYFQSNGRKLFQFIKTKNGWKICSVIWEDGNVE